MYKRQCQFCTVAHIAHISATVGFFKLSNIYGSSDWNVSGNATVVDVAAKERRKRGGYVAPKQAKSVVINQTVINNISDSVVQGDVGVNKNFEEE